jgi:hypothetical protein
MTDDTQRLEVEVAPSYVEGDCIWQKNELQQGEADGLNDDDMLLFPTVTENLPYLEPPCRIDRGSSNYGWLWIRYWNLDPISPGPSNRGFGLFHFWSRRAAWAVGSVPMALPTLLDTWSPCNRRVSEQSRRTTRSTCVPKTLQSHMMRHESQTYESLPFLSP